MEISPQMFALRNNTYNLISIVGTDASSFTGTLTNMQCLDSGCTINPNSMASANIGDIGKKISPVEFQINNVTIFKADFSKSPLSVTPSEGTDYVVSLDKFGILVTAPIITFQNNTYSYITIAGTDLTSFIPLEYLLCSVAYGCEIIPNSTNTGIIGDILNLLQPIQCQLNNTTIFTADFTTSPPSIKEVGGTGYSVSQNEFTVAITAPTISFTNNTLSPIIISADANAFVGQLTNLSAVTGGWEIAPGKNSGPITASATIGDIINATEPVQFSIGTLKLFTVDFTALPPRIVTQAVGYSVKSDATGFNISIAAPTMIFHNNTYYPITIADTDATSFMGTLTNMQCGTTGCAINANSTATGMIGDIAKLGTVSFQVGSTQIFTGNFSGPTPTITEAAASGFGAVNIGFKTTITAPIMTFQNNSYYPITIAGTDSTSFIGTLSNMQCLATGCTINANSCASGTIGDIAKLGTVSFQVGSTQIFTGNFSGPTPTITEISGSSFAVTSKGFTTTIAAPIMSFVNNSAKAFTIKGTDANAFTGKLSKMQCLEPPCTINAGPNIAASGVIGDVVSMSQPVMFNDENGSAFSIDFSVNPPKALAIGQGYEVSAVTPLENGGGFSVTIAFALSIQANLTGSLTQMVQDMTNVNNYIYGTPSGGLKFNFSENIYDLQHWELMLFYPLSVSLMVTDSVGSLVNLTTVPQANLGTTDNRVSLTNASTFLNSSITGSVDIDFISTNGVNPYTGLDFKDINVSISALPSGSIKVSTASNANISMIGQVYDQINKVTNPFTMCLGAPISSTSCTIPFNIPVNLYPFYAFNSISAASFTLNPDFNVGRVDSTGTLFMFTLPLLSAPWVGLSEVGPDLKGNPSNITIKDRINTVVMNIAGPLSPPGALVVSGTFYGTTFSGGSAILNSTDQPSISVSLPASVLNGVKFTYNYNLTGSISLNFS